jgi:hypothetical protein
MYLQVSIAGTGTVADAAIPVLRSSVEALRQRAGAAGLALRVDFDVSGEPERPPSAGMPPSVVPAEPEPAVPTEPPAAPDVMNEPIESAASCRPSASRREEAP